MLLLRTRLTKTMLGLLRVFDGWLRNNRAMIRAGQEIAWQLQTAGPRRDQSGLLWRAYDKYGVVLRDTADRVENEMERKRAMVTTVEECVTLARAELRVAKAKVLREIRSYPTPIAGCDAQFNHLLSERTRISTALRALDPDCCVPAPKAL